MFVFTQLLGHGKDVIRLIQQILIQSFPSLRLDAIPDYLLIGRGRIVACILSPKLLALCEMQTALSGFEFQSAWPFSMTITTTQ